MARASGTAESLGMVHDALNSDSEPMSPSSPLPVRSPAEAIACVPYLFGFVPRRSAVLLLTDEQGDLVLSCRVDLPRPGDVGEWTRQIGDVVARALGDRSVGKSGRRRNGQAVPLGDPAGKRTGDALIIAFAASKGERTVRAAVPALARVLEENGIRVLDQLWTWGSRWRSLSCPDPLCCPPGGKRIDAAAHARAAAAFPGREVVARREDLRSALQPADPQIAAEVERLLAGIVPIEEDQRDIAISQAHDLLVGTTPSAEEAGREEWVAAAAPSPAQSALVLAALRDTRVRDTLIWDLLRAPRGSWNDMRSVLEFLVRWAPRGDVAPVATVLGILHWQCGDGTRASVALERAQEDDPAYALAELVDASVAAGIPPGEWLAGLRGLSRDACRRAG